MEIRSERPVGLAVQLSNIMLTLHNFLLERNIANFVLEFLNVSSTSKQNIVSKGFLFLSESCIVVDLLSVPYVPYVPLFSVDFFACISCYILPPRDFNIKNPHTFPNWILSCLSFLPCLECTLSLQLKMANFLTKFSYQLQMNSTLFF